jgi:hypothetical protein
MPALPPVGSQPLAASELPHADALLLLVLQRLKAGSSGSSHSFPDTSEAD